jgi:hypothetical protein
MAETLVDHLLAVLETYLVLGVVVAVWVEVFALQQLDPVAAHGTWGFRVLVFPGLVLLWPVMLCKGWKARRHRYDSPDAEQPVSARRLRQTHGAAFGLLAVMLPLLFAGALLWRRPEISPIANSPSVNLAAVSLPVEVPLTQNQPGALPIGVSLWRDAGAQRQLEVATRAELSAPVVALYWSAQPAGPTLPHDAVFLGGVWGPQTMRFGLPEKAAANSGSLYFIALGESPEILTTLDLHPR